MSSLAAAFNSTAVLFTNDFYKIRYPEANERKLVLVGRLATTAVVVITILIVPLVKLISSQIYLFLQSVQAFVSPPITAVFLFALFSKRITAKTATITLIVGEFIGLSMLFIAMLKNWGILLHPILISLLGINFLHFAMFLFLLCVGIITILNYISVEQPSKFTVGLRNSVVESLKDISYSVSNLKSVNLIRTNLIFSAFILLIILGLWSIWY